MHLHPSSYNDGIALTIAHRVALFNAIKDNEEPQQVWKDQLNTWDHGVLTVMKNTFLFVLT